jgi:hypothetical protein
MTSGVTAKKKANDVAKTQKKATLVIMDLIDSTLSSAFKQKALEVESTLQSSGQAPMTNDISTAPPTTR